MFYQTIRHFNNLETLITKPFENIAGNGENFGSVIFQEDVKVLS